MRRVRYITFNCVNTVIKITDILRYTKCLCFLGEDFFVSVSYAQFGVYYGI